MAFGALTSAQAVADALMSGELTPLRIQKALRHLKTEDERAAVLVLLPPEAQTAFRAEADRPARRRF